MVFDIPRLYIKTPPGQLPRDGKTVFYSLKGNQRKAGMKKPGIFNKYRAFSLAAGEGFELWAVCKMLYNAVQNSEKQRENCR